MISGCIEKSRYFALFKVFFNNMCSQADNETSSIACLEIDL
jgi:hypothetical protein